MKRKLYRQAKRLAAYGYTAIVTREYVDKGYAYTLTFAELPAWCRLYYDTLDELREDQDSALIDFIYFLLLECGPVPGAL